MISVFFFTYNYSGVSTYANELLPYFAEQAGVEVNNVCMGSVKHNEFTVLKEDGLCTIFIPEMKRYGNNPQKTANRCLDLLYPFLREKTQIIFHLNHPMQLYLVPKAKSRHNVNSIYTVHCLPECFSSVVNVNDAIKGIPLINEDLDKELKSNIDGVICVTQFSYNILNEHYQFSDSKLAHVYNGCGSQLKEKTDCSQLEKERLKISLGYSADNKIVLFVGRLMPGKGVTALIKAFNEVCSDNYSLRLILVGDGEYDTYLRLAQRNPGQISFLGKLSPKQLKLYYTIADIGIIPSSYEQCSYVALEMMKYGLPIVASDVPGLRELFHHKYTALLVPTSRQAGVKGKEGIDEYCLAEHLTWLLNNETCAKELGEQARLIWEQKYTANHMGKSTLEFYQNVLVESSE